MAEHKAYRGQSETEIAFRLNKLEKDILSTRSDILRLQGLELDLACSIREAQTALKLLRLKHYHTMPRRQVGIGDGKEILSRAELMREIGVCSATLNKMCSDGRLPPPIRISPNKLGFRRSRIKQWIDANSQNQ